MASGRAGRAGRSIGASSGSMSIKSSTGLILVPSPCTWMPSGPSPLSAPPDVSLHFGVRLHSSIRQSRLEHQWGLLSQFIPCLVRPSGLASLLREASLIREAWAPLEASLLGRCGRPWWHRHVRCILCPLPTCQWLLILLFLVVGQAGHDFTLFPTALLIIND
jgi:hypothetical protein